MTRRKQNNNRSSASTGADDDDCKNETNVPSPLPPLERASTSTAAAAPPALSLERQGEYRAPGAFAIQRPSHQYGILSRGGDGSAATNGVRRERLSRLSLTRNRNRNQRDRTTSCGTSATGTTNSYTEENEDDEEVWCDDDDTEAAAASAIAAYRVPVAQLVEVPSSDLTEVSSLSQSMDTSCLRRNGSSNAENHRAVIDRHDVEIAHEVYGGRAIDENDENDTTSKQTEAAPSTTASSPTCTWFILKLAGLATLLAIVVLIVSTVQSQNGDDGTPLNPVPITITTTAPPTTQNATGDVVNTTTSSTNSTSTPNNDTEIVQIGASLPTWCDSDDTTEQADLELPKVQQTLCEVAFVLDDIENDPNAAATADTWESETIVATKRANVVVQGEESFLLECTRGNSTLLVDRVQKRQMCADLQAILDEWRDGDGGGEGDSGNGGKLFGGLLKLIGGDRGNGRDGSDRGT